MPIDCSQNTDQLKLVREGTSQDGRLPEALDPAYAPVNEHTVAHSMVFAQSYAALLKYFDEKNIATADWVPFFGNDVSVQLAIAAVEDVEAYKTNTQSWFDYLNRLEPQPNETLLKNNLGFLYSGVATLAQQLDVLKEGFPGDIALKGTLQNLIKSQLAPAFKRLIAYYQAGVMRSLVNAVVPLPTVLILRRPVVSFASVISAGLSTDWSEGRAWSGYAGGIAEDQSVYGDASASVFVPINHCSTHNLFTSVFDQFLKVFARVTSEAKTALDGTLTGWDKHEPHYALYLAFLRLFEYARASSNTLTQRHLDFYYREILRLKEKSAEPGHVHLLAELAKRVSSHEFKTGELFKAGKDGEGREAFFANTNDFVANQAKVAALKTVYRHGDEPAGSLNNGRIYASPVANSDDGLGAKLISVDQSWHPFNNKVYIDGALKEIHMPEADVGFAIASHYLLMAEGHRVIRVAITVDGYSSDTEDDFKNDMRCFLTTEKGWLEKESQSFIWNGIDTFVMFLEISGADAPITPYSSKVHGHTFETNLPMLLVELKQDYTRSYVYQAFQNVVVTGITLIVEVDNVKSLAISNDFGPVDTSKPFQPFGASPIAGSSLVIGSKEVFQKKLSHASVSLSWLAAPKPFHTSPTVDIDFLSQGQWEPSTITAVPVGSKSFHFSGNLDVLVTDEADFSANEFYSTASRHGFAKLKLTDGFGQKAYQSALLRYLRKDLIPKSKPPKLEPEPKNPPVGPAASALSMSYGASMELVLSTSAKDIYENRLGQFFHLAPFGTAEQHPYLNASGKVSLFPQFDFARDNATLESEAELYIGISGLQPPQNLSLLFQVADGTANPRLPKPKPHIDWRYLKNNEWTAFAENEIQDGTGELLGSGIMTFAVPRDATSNNTLLPSGNFWIRAAVHEKSDAVCKLQLVAAQAMPAVFGDRGNSPEFSATPLAAGTISKLDQPDSAVKTISQPFSSFGGRGAEKPTAFYTRISERLRHKDRAIDLWDYERLILGAFPQIYKVKCLNHTYYDEGIYRELAPGHITVVTIPNLQTQNLRDPLKPFTSLGLLQQIEAFLKKRTSCFARLHVKNPQFEAVRVSFMLRLVDGYDETFYKKLLKESITRFLSPWAFTDGGTPFFGGKIYKSMLINFIEDQVYVDYVIDFQLFQDIEGQPPGTRDLDGPAIIPYRKLGSNLQ